MSLWGKTDAAGSKPKFLNTDDATATVGVSVTEAQNANNRSAGIKTPGWNKVTSYTDAQGNVRNKVETLVAFAGDITSDAADDAVAGDRVITISVHPVSTSVVTGGTATFSVTAAVAPTTTLTYQWQKQEAGTRTWTNVSGATSASYTTDVLTVAADNGDKYRVVVGAADTRSINSNSATLTVTAE